MKKIQDLIDVLGVENNKTREIFTYIIAEIMVDKNLLESVNTLNTDGTFHMVYRDPEENEYLAVEIPDLNLEQEEIFNRELSTILNGENLR